MERLRDCMHPTPFDSMSNYGGEIPDPQWLCLMARHRDSDILTQSNWDCALEQLGGESDTVKIIRIGHWAVGWIEYITILDGSPQKAIGDDIERGLADYPILNEEHFSAAEHEEANRIWQSCYNWQDRIDYIRKFRSQFEFRDFSDLLHCVKGEYFAGYASELIG